METFTEEEFMPDDDFFIDGFGRLLADLLVANIIDCYKNSTQFKIIKRKTCLIFKHVSGICFRINVQRDRNLEKKQKNRLRNILPYDIMQTIVYSLGRGENPHRQ
jgi:hypothetical protein